jgi:hypothetical protein
VPPPQSSPQPPLPPYAAGGREAVLKSKRLAKRLNRVAVAINVDDEDRSLVLDEDDIDDMEEFPGEDEAAMEEEEMGIKKNEMMTLIRMAMNAVDSRKKKGRKKK